MRIDRVTFVAPVRDEIRVLVPAPVDRGSGPVEEILKRHDGPDLLEVRDVEFEGDRARHRLGHRGLTDFLVDTLRARALRPNRTNVTGALAPHGVLSPHKRAVAG
jgi:hypothetical protein